jgi:hypothetical protein
MTFRRLQRLRYSIPGLDPLTVTATEKARADLFTYDQELSKMSTCKIILRWHLVEFESRARARRVKNVGNDTGEEEKIEDSEAELRGIQLRLESVCLIVDVYLNPNHHDLLNFFANGKYPYSYK